MSLKENPIFLTQKRLVHRGGVLAAILLAALVGGSLFSGLIAYLAAPIYFPTIKSAQDAGKMLYGWTIAVEIIVLIAGGFIRIARALADERKAGLWDSNRLTPLTQWQLVAGYWLGAPLREFYMGAVLAGIGLLIVLFAKLPLTLWLGTQVLIFGTALFLGLFGILAGLTFQRPQGSIIFLLLFLLLQAFPFFETPRFFITNFLLPVYATCNLFADNANASSGYNYEMDEWGRLPEIFGLPVYPLLLTLALQLIVGIFVWRAISRKTANPFQPALSRWEAVALFAVLLTYQHGLIWDQWRGHFPDLEKQGGNFDVFERNSLLSTVHLGTIVLAIIILAFFSPKPESIRLKALRLGIKTPGAVFFDSSAFLALLFGAISALVLVTQFARSITGSWQIYLVAAGNLIAFMVIFSFLLEFCRLRHKRRALGFLLLWLFIFCVLPFILAGVFSNGAFGYFSLFSPGYEALADSENQDLNCLLGVVGAHLLIALLLFIVWRREWQKLLAHAS